MDSIDHYYEACYQVWKRGRNPDRVRYDESDDDHWRDREPEYTASRELKRQAVEKQRRIDAWEESGGWDW